MQIVLDAEGYIVGLSAYGCLADAIEVDDYEFIEVNPDILNCYKWKNGKARLDKKKQAAMPSEDEQDTEQELYELFLAEQEQEQRDKFKAWKKKQKEEAT